MPKDRIVMASTVSGPLEGITILDMTTELSGPYAAKIMGDLGANIIKVESFQGDGQRRSGPSLHTGMSSQFLHTNRSKRSIAIDLKKPAGRETLLRLSKKADVLMYNVRRQAMARLRLAYEDLSAVNPRIVYCGVCGYGQGGRYEDMPAYDDVIQGLTGMADLQSKLTGGKPRYIPLNIVDRNSGMVLVQTVLAALLYRERTGHGQAVELPLFETLAEIVLSDHMYGRTFDPPLSAGANARVMNRWPARTKDGYLCFWISSDEGFARFWDVIGRPDVKADERFITRVNRNNHLVELLGLVDSELPKRTTAEWLEIFGRADFPAMPMHTIDTLMDDPHLREVGFFRKVRHPTEGDIVSMAVTSRWSRSSPVNSRLAPLLGEHTHEILSEAGFPDSEISSLVASGAVLRAA